MGILLQQRQELYVRQNGTGGGSSTVFTAIAASVISVILLITLSWFGLRYLRLKNHSPKLLPSKYLKQKWNNWSPGNARRYGQVPGETSTRNENTAYNGAATSTESDAPRRGPSVRSIISLPSYSMFPKPEEQVIAREGERGGMDIVVEFPETAEEEEGRREDEMQSLYQIRLRRRQEIAEREERRRLRREARAAGDLARLQQISRESMVAPASNQTVPTAATMLAEHQSRGREQRISAVTYADLGHVRHDGSRIRANSSDSDQRPLLDSAASMGFDGRASIQSLAHNRGLSASSNLSRTSTHSSQADTLQPTTSRPDSPYEHDGDVGTSHIPPPEYDHLEWGEAPAYESPIAARGEHLSQLPAIDTGSLPSIRIDTATPLTSAAPTPAMNTPATPKPLDQSSSGELFRSPGAHS